MNQPMVSVVLATYRREAPLKYALQSLMRQTYENIEIIVVDDNDDPVWNDIVRSAVSECGEAVRLIENHPNLGSANARNAGIQQASGEYITFLDDDDVYLPDKIARQVAAMTDSEADYCITDLELFSENEKLTERRVRDYIRSAEPGDLLKYHLMYHMTGTDTLMFRADYLRKIGGFPPIDVGDEFYLMTQAIIGGGRLCYLPGCDVKAYIHTGENGGLSSGEGKIRGENELYEYKKQFFPELDAKSRRYIKMRHHAVLAFAYLREKSYRYFVIHGVGSFFAAPIACVRLLTKRR